MQRTIRPNSKCLWYTHNNHIWVIGIGIRPIYSSAPELLFSYMIIMSAAAIVIVCIWAVVCMGLYVRCLSRCRHLCILGRLCINRVNPKNASW